jgi:hypothetical protein
MEWRMLNLPHDILLSEIRPRLHLKEISRLARTCSGSHTIFQNVLDATLLEELQLGVVVGREDKKLMPIMKNRSDLLLKKSKVTDGAGRTFHDNSPWQNALWCKDWHR